MPSRFYRVPLSEIAYLRAVIEGYDGLAVVRALDPNRGEVELVIGEGLEEEALLLSSRLASETGLVEIERPSDWETLDAAADRRRGLVPSRREG